MKEILLTVSSSSLRRSSLATFLTFFSGLHFFGSEGNEGQASLEAETVFDAIFLFLESHLGDMNDINIYGVGIFGRFSWEGSMVVGLSDGVFVLFGNQVCSFPLSLKVDSFGIPGSDGIRRGVHGVDLSHKSSRDVRREVPDENIVLE